ncbi:hypothetical protein GCM10010277_20210 [Streptomyces longisporoflavus]|nr:hypothetical protein [Streptomyces longisporoflavus]GGV34756.1 hypothetical protein GCM10010277_20210 [Streptomyces longisporoflavus]
MESLAGQARAISVDPAEHHQLGQVKIAAPFLGEFVKGVQDRT